MVEFHSVTSETKCPDINYLNVKIRRRLLAVDVSRRPPIDTHSMVIISNLDHGSSNRSKKTDYQAPQIDNQRRTPLPEGRYEAHGERGVGQRIKLVIAVSNGWATCRSSRIHRADLGGACGWYVDSCVCHLSVMATGIILVSHHGSAPRRSSFKMEWIAWSTTPLLLFAIVLRSNSYFTAA
jgi:hypothetical protein